MKHVTCNLCGRDEWRVRFPATMASGLPQVEAFRCTSPYYGNHPQIVECRHCGLVYANPRWSASEILAAYQAVEDETYLQEQADRRKTFKKHLSNVQRFTGDADGRRLLDVGAYTGVFVDVAREAGWDACGVEPSRWATEIAQGAGLPVVNGNLDDLADDERYFHVITMWDVIEHMDDPAGELAKTYDLLLSGGVIVVHTMDIGSTLARVMGGRWPWLMDMHIFYFSRQTLVTMLEKIGFEVIWSGAQGRYLSLRYLATRLEAINRPIGRMTAGIVQATGVGSASLRVNLGDLMTVVARKPTIAVAGG